MFERDTLYFITNRTLQGRFLLKPSPYVNNLIGGVLARGLTLFNVQLYAFVFTSNHFHMVVKAAGGQLSPFMMYVESNIARKVGRHIDWRGKFWERRFSAAPILDDEAVFDRIRYIFSHGVKEGLVHRATDWPGLTCIPELVHGQRRQFPWYDWTARTKARMRGEHLPADSFAAYHPLELTPLPPLENHTPHEQQCFLRTLLEAAETQARELRGGKPVLGVRKVLQQHPHDSPKQSKRSPRPMCHASTREARRLYRRAYKTFVEAFRHASDALRKGQVDADFPQGAYRPPLPYQWVSVAAADQPLVACS